jgi:mannitol/fructose-specific phosphotransferase system IIA component (Ntr-type)
MVMAEAPSTITGTIGVVELRHRRRDSALAQLVAEAVRMEAVREGEVLLATLQRAERAASSALGKGVAVPHARSLVVTRSLTVVGRSARGIEWDPGSTERVHLVLLVASPGTTSVAMHVDRVVTLAHALRLQRSRQRLLEAEEASAGELLRSELS